MKEEEIFYYHRLPHWQPPGATIFFTWRLFGSLPSEVLERLRAERARLEKEPKRRNESVHAREMRHNKVLFKITDEYLDRAEHGPLWLKDERLAALATDALFHFNGSRYDLVAFVVMANHVHALLTPREMNGKYVLMRTITQGLKGYISRQANLLLGHTGQPFWQKESYDHWARSTAEILRIVAYIENNPVKAGLVARPEAWRWSSAWERTHGRLVGQVL